MFLATTPARRTNTKKWINVLIYDTVILCRYHKPFIKKLKRRKCHLVKRLVKESFVCWRKFKWNTTTLLTSDSEDVPKESVLYLVVNTTIMRSQLPFMVQSNRLLDYKQRVQVATISIIISSSDQELSKLIGLPKHYKLMLRFPRPPCWISLPKAQC